MCPDWYQSLKNQKTLQEDESNLLKRASSASMVKKGFFNNFKNDN